MPALLIPAAADILAVLDIIYRLSTAKNVDSKTGKLQLVLTTKKRKTFWLVVVLALVLINLLFFRKFALWVSLVLGASGVLAVDLAIRDWILQSRSGVYENAVITRGRILMKDDIVSFPTLEYEKTTEEGTVVPPEMLKTVTNSIGVTYLEFVDEEERNKAVEIMKNWVK